MPGRKHELRPTVLADFSSSPTRLASGVSVRQDVALLSAYEQAREQRQRSAPWVSKVLRLTAGSLCRPTVIVATGSEPSVLAVAGYERRSSSEAERRVRMLVDTYCTRMLALWPCPHMPHRHGRGRCTRRGVVVHLRKYLSRPKKSLRVIHLPHRKVPRLLGEAETTDSKSAMTRAKRAATRAMTKSILSWWRESVRGEQEWADKSEEMHLVGSDLYGSTRLCPVNPVPVGLTNGRSETLSKTSDTYRRPSASRIAHCRQRARTLLPRSAARNLARKPAEGGCREGVGKCDQGGLDARDGTA